MDDLKKIAEELGIDVPILAVKQKGDALELHLYGGRVEVWKPGSAEGGDLEDLTVAELRDLAKEAGEITGHSSMTKAELIEALQGVDD